MGSRSSRNSNVARTRRSTSAVSAPSSAGGRSISSTCTSCSRRPSGRRRTRTAQVQTPSSVVTQATSMSVIVGSVPPPWQVGHQYVDRGRSVPWRVDADRRAAAAARPAGAAVDVQRPGRAAIAGRGDALGAAPRASTLARSSRRAVAISRSQGLVVERRAPARTATPARSRGPRSCRRCRCRRAPAGRAGPRRSRGRRAPGRAGGDAPRRRRSPGPSRSGPSARQRRDGAPRPAARTARRPGASKQTATEPGHLEDEACPRRPAAATRSPGPVAMPRPVHPQVGPQLEAAVEPDEQVLALGLDRVDPLADDAMDLRDRARALRAGRGHVASDEVRPQAGGGPGERVAFGHRLSASPRRVSPR